MHDTGNFKIGDTLTVLLTERTQAQKRAATTTSKATDVAIANPTLFGRTPTLDEYKKAVKGINLTKFAPPQNVGQMGLSVHF